MKKLNIKEFLMIKKSFINIFILVAYCIAITVLLILFANRIIELQERVIILEKGQKCGNVDYRQIAIYTEEIINRKFEEIQLIKIKDSNLTNRTVENLNNYMKKSSKEIELMKLKIKELEDGRKNILLRQKLKNN